MITVEMSVQDANEINIGLTMFTHALCYREQMTAQIIGESIKHIQKAITPVRG